MITELKKEVESKFGKKIEKRGDCEMISNAILEFLDIEISYNTLRRLYGLAPYTKPNTKTLNTLAQFVGYNNYYHFSKKYIFKDITKIFQITYKCLYDNNEAELLELVKNTKRSNEDFVDFIILVIRELFYRKRYTLINAIFNLKELHYTKFSYTELLCIGNSIGLILREENRVDKILTKNINFINCIYLTFVDYSSLNSYYGKWAISLKKSKISKEIRVFNNAVLQFKNFLNNKEIKELDEYLIYNQDIHPILCSRLLASKLLVNDNGNSINTSQILDSYFELHSKKSSLVDYSYELFTTAILTKNYVLMKYLIEKTNLNTTIEFYYQKSHLNSYYLMSIFYFKYTQNSVEEKRHNRLFSINDCMYSYEDFITILYHIYVFGSTKIGSKKDRIKKEYIQLSKQLTTPTFQKAIC